MQTHAFNPGLWAPRVATLTLWAAAVGSAAFWALQGSGGPQRQAAEPLAAVPVTQIDPQTLTLALGGSHTPAAATSAGPSAPGRLQLLGVVARPGQSGAALIAIDGKPARVVRVGDVVEGDLRLLSVQGRNAALGPKAGAPATLQLEMPPLPQLP